MSVCSSQTEEDLILCDWQLLAADCSACGEEALDVKTEEFWRKGSVNESQMAVRQSGSMRIEKVKEVKRESGPFDRRYNHNMMMLVMRLDIMFYTTVIITNWVKLREE